MSHASFRLLALAAATTLISGCNPAATPMTSYDTQNLTGNWQVSISDPPYPGPFPIASLTGAVAGSGQNVTATLRATGTGCVSPTQDITFTGSQLADGTLILTSTNLPNNVVSISAMAGGIMPLANQTALFLGSLLVTGTGPCTMANIALRGEEFAPLTGTFTGPVNSTSGSTATFTAALTQAAANSDGQFPETGMITVAGSNCTNTFSLAGLVAGPGLTASLTPISGPAATATVTTGPPFGGATNMISFGMTITGTGCNAGTFTGSLARQ
jgi:hypothetical protein